LDFSEIQSQDTIIDLPLISSPPTLDNRRALGSLPTSPATPNAHSVHAEYDQMEDIAQDIAESDFFHSDPRSSPSYGSEVGHNLRELHPKINGRFLFHFDHTPS